MIFQDFLLDEDGDLLIRDGDFVVGPSDDQHIADIIQSFTGEWKQSPSVGAGIIQYLNSEEAQESINIITQQLQADKYTIKEMKADITDGDLKISFPNNGIQRNNG